MISLFEQKRKRQKNQTTITQQKGHPTIAGKVQDTWSELKKIIKKISKSQVQYNLTILVIHELQITIGK